MLSKSDSEIIAYLKNLDSDIKQMKHEIMKLCWYMRGGLTMTEAFTMAPQDREVISKIVKENLETTKKTGQPFF